MDQVQHRGCGTECGQRDGNIDPGRDAVQLSLGGSSRGAGRLEGLGGWGAGGLGGRREGWGNAAGGLGGRQGDGWVWLDIQNGARDCADVVMHLACFPFISL